MLGCDPSCPGAAVVARILPWFSSGNCGMIFFSPFFDCSVAYGVPGAKGQI